MIKARIGVLADTHIRTETGELPRELADGLKGVDYIIHAGDFMKGHVLDQLNKIAYTYGVLGNNDFDSYLLARLPAKKIISIEGIRIGITHSGESTWMPTVESAKKAFKGEDVNCIVFGHSHKPYLEKENGILVFNPGSAMQKRREPFCSYGILKISEKGITAEHIYLSF